MLITSVICKKSEMSLSEHEKGAVKAYLGEMGIIEPWPLQDPAFRKSIDLFLDGVGRQMTELHHFFNNFDGDAQRECLKRVNAIRVIQLSKKYSAVRDKLRAYAK